jgi:phosphate/sulfate permease
MWRMRWFKVAAIGVGVLIAFFVAMSVIGVVFKVITDLVIAAIVVGAIAVAIKVASSRRQVSGKKAEREVREPDQQYSRPLPRADVEPVSTPYPPSRPATQDVDDELARLKREMGG